MIKLPQAHDYQFVLVTTMKDECPYIIDWLSYHFSIGFTHAVILTNDCSDKTDNLCRNLQELGVVTHKNNKAPYPRGIQKTAWARSERLEPIRKAEWVMALDVDEYLYLSTGDGQIQETLALFDRPPAAISFVWQIFGNDGIKKISNMPVPFDFKRASHPLQAKPYTIRGFKTLFRKACFGAIGTHRPHDTRMEALNGAHWVNGDGAPVDELFLKPFWCVWDNGYLGGGALGRVHHYALRSKQAFFVKIQRGFVNRTDKGMRSENSPMKYWESFDWNIVRDDKITARHFDMDWIKGELLSHQKIKRIWQNSFNMHKQMAQEIIKYKQEYPDELSEIWRINPKTQLRKNDPVLEPPEKPMRFKTENFASNFIHTLIPKSYLAEYYHEIERMDAK